MDNRKWLSGAKATPPTAPGSPSAGYPTGGNPLVNEPPTNPGPWWFHQMGEELRAVIVAAGLTPDHSTLNQLLSAMQAMFGQVLSTSGTPDGFKIGSLVVQFGTYASDVSTDLTDVTITLPHVFATAALWGSVSDRNSSGDNTADGHMVLKSLSTTSLVATLHYSAGASALVHGFTWIAIGH